MEEFSGVKLQHLNQYSFDPHLTSGNIENFTGVAQVPIGFAGPLQINGEHAQGEFLIPLATTEGTLVASYNRGMKVLNLCGGRHVHGGRRRHAARAGVRLCGTRAPRAISPSGCRRTSQRSARKPRRPPASPSWSTSNPISPASFVYLRFNYTTGDAAGQNMVGRATFAACSWILDHYPGIQHFYLESNFATDKKASQVNIMRTRGKRVTAEAVITRDVLIQHMRVEPESLTYHYGIANVGSLLSGANNNGLHSANAHHRDVHRHRAGRGQRLRVVGRHRLHRADPRERTSTSRSPSPR